MSKMKNKPHVRIKLERDYETGNWVWGYSIKEIRWPVLQTVKMPHLWAAHRFIREMNAKEGRPHA